MSHGEFLEVPIYTMTQFPISIISTEDYRLKSVVFSFFFADADRGFAHKSTVALLREIAAEKYHLAFTSGNVVKSIIIEKAMPAPQRSMVSDAPRARKTVRARNCVDCFYRKGK
jgi:hypothetical protein